MITFVYAQDERGGIGFENKIPWNLPHDMQHFKNTTMGHTMVMGRRTFESMNQRLLPGRQTVVVSNQPGYGQDIEGLIVVHSAAEVIEMGKEKDLMVIGGAGLFAHLVSDVDQIIRTHIFHTFPADVFVPKLDENEWERVKIESGPTNEANPYQYQYEWWKRK